MMIGNAYGSTLHVTIWHGEEGYSRSPGFKEYSDGQVQVYRSYVKYVNRPPLSFGYVIKNIGLGPDMSWNSTRFETYD